MNAGWMADAACRGRGPALFYPERGQTGGRDASNPARMVCDGCKVRGECLDWAIETGETAGMWGGLSPRERQVEASRRRRLRVAS